MCFFPWSYNLLFGCYGVHCVALKRHELAHSENRGADFPRHARFMCELGVSVLLVTRPSDYVVGSQKLGCLFQLIQCHVQMPGSLAQNCLWHSSVDVCEWDRLILMETPHGSLFCLCKTGESGLMLHAELQLFEWSQNSKKWVQGQSIFVLCVTHASQTTGHKQRKYQEIKHSLVTGKEAVVHRRSGEEQQTNPVREQEKIKNKFQCKVKKHRKQY